MGRWQPSPPPILRRLSTAWFLLICFVIGVTAGLVARERQAEFGRKYLWLWSIPINYLVVTGFFSFVYQGYREDAGSEPVQSWPLGVISWAFALAIAWIAFRKRPPSELQFGLVIFSFIALVLWTWVRINGP